MGEWDVVHTTDPNASADDPWAVKTTTKADPWMPVKVDGKSMLQKVAEATSVPMRGLRGIGVGVEKIFTGNDPTVRGRVGEAATAATEATSPDYKPKPGEKIGAFAGELLDPRYMALGEIGAAGAVTPWVKAALAGGTALGGTAALEDVARTGGLNPKNEAIATAEGAAGGVLLHGGVKAVAAGARKVFSDVAGKIVDRALPPEGGNRPDFADLVQAKPPTPPSPLTPQEPPPNLILPKSPAPLTEPIQAAGAVKGSKEVTEWLDRLKRVSEGVPTSLDLAMMKTEPVAEVARAQKLNVEQMGQVADAVAPALDRGATPAEISKATGVPKKVVEAGQNLNPPFETSEMKVHDAAVQGDPAAQLSLLQRAWKYWVSNPTEASSQAKLLYKRRYGEIGLGYFESRLFIRDSVHGLSDIERQALPFIIEGKVPEAGKFMHPQSQEILDTAQRYLQNPNDPAMRNLAVAHDKIGRYLDEGHEFLKANFDEMGYHDNYINHLWERNPQTSTYGPSGASLSEKNPFARRRFIGSYAEGINQGMTPKTLDIEELLKAYDNYKIKAVANKRFRGAIESLTTENGLPVIMPSSSAPIDYKYIDSNFFTGAKVSPEVYDAVRAIVDKPFAFSEPGPHAPMSQKAFYQALNAYEYLNAYSKKIRLSASFFHHFSLTETALSSGINPLKVVGKQATSVWKSAEWDSLKDLPAALYKSFMEGHAAMENVPLARDAIKHGLLVGSIGDVERGTVMKGLLSVERKLNEVVPIASKAFKGIRTFNEIWDKTLWDYYHSGLKLSIYEEHLSQNIQKYGDTVPLEQLKMETAEYVNKATGGALERLLYSPKYRQALHWAFLAPDWTLTRLQTAAAMFKPGPQGYQARKFWLRAGLAYFSFANTLNYIRTKKAGLLAPDGTPGRFIWNNDPGKEDHVFWKKDENSRNLYIMPAKTLVEVLGWFHHPGKTLGSKAAPAIQMTAEALQKGDRTLTGFNIPDTEKGVGKFVQRNITPFSFQKSNFAFTLPTSRGISKTQVIELLEKGISKGDQKAIQTALKFGVENGYDVQTLKSIAIKNIRSKMKKAALNPGQ